MKIWKKLKIACLNPKKLPKLVEIALNCLKLHEIGLHEITENCRKLLQIDSNYPNFAAIISIYNRKLPKSDFKSLSKIVNIDDKIKIATYFHRTTTPLFGLLPGTHFELTWQHGVCIFHTASTIFICELLHRSERKISLVEVIWKYHIAPHCSTAWSCVLHTFAAFPPSPSLGPRSFATRFRKGLV